MRREGATLDAARSSSYKAAAPGMPFRSAAQVATGQLPATATRSSPQVAELPSGTGQFAAPQEKKPKECELSLWEPQHNGAARTIWETLLFHASSSPKCMDISVDHKANFCLFFFVVVIF